jgi:phage-related protein
LSDIFNPVIDALQNGGSAAAFDSLLSGFKDLTGFDLSPFTGSIKTITTAIDGFLESGVSGAFENIVGSFEKMTGFDLSPIKEHLGRLGEAVDQVALAFSEGGLDAAVDELGAQLDDLTGLDVSGFFNGMKEAYKNAVSAFNEGGLKSMVAELWESFRSAGPKLLEAGQSILTNIGIMLTRIGQSIYNAMPENIQALIDSIGRFFQSLWDYLKVVWEQIEPFVLLIGLTLVESLKTAWEAIKVIFNTLVEALTDVFDFLSAQFDLIVALWEGDFEAAGEAIKRAWNSVLSFFGSIVDGVRGLFEGLVGYFANIGTRLWEGLKSGLSAAIDGVKDLASDIADGFKSFFGINSPSRLFAEYGGYMAKGLEKGWDSEIDSAVKRMSKGVNIQGNIDFASSSLGKSSSAQINTMLAGMQERGGSYNINLVVDGRTLANVVFDPLNAVSKQKGVAIGA